MMTIYEATKIVRNGDDVKDPETYKAAMDLLYLFFSNDDIVKIMNSK